MRYKINHQQPVDFALMHGREAVAALRACPVGYLPIGCLERHGDHLPMGLDVLKAHAVCRLAAQALGGVVFPPHHYAGIHQMTDEQLAQYTGAWGNLYTDASAEAALLDILRQLARMGLRVVVLYSGHYPACQVAMLERLAAAARAFALTVIPFAECLALAGDHAGLSETSLMLYLDAAQVDMTRIGPDNYRDHGWGAHNAPDDASAAEGEREVEVILEYLAGKLAEALR